MNKQDVIAFFDKMASNWDADMIKNDEVTLVINTTEGRQSIADSFSIRRNALQRKIYFTTTLAGGQAVCEALKFGPEKTVRRLQDLHAGINA